jgi:hypothetical protein
MEQKNTNLQIFNLEFPPYIKKLKIGNYIFKRVKNYKETFDGMMCLVNSFGSEFNTQIKVGSHQITATVELPQKEKKCILPFGNNNSTQLDDILFLLTIFTGRNVFKRDWEDSENIAIMSDHRIHQYGGQLVCSIQYDSMWENNINKVLDLISSKQWQNDYEGGYFLFLFKSAIQRQIIETAFISCWTIWEHVFAIRNRKWLDNTAIEQMSGDKKIAFILNEYFLKSIDDTVRKNIQKINKTRNRLVHFGKKTEQIDYKEMEMFIRLTEQLIAVILELSPSNIFNSFEALDSFLTYKKN